MDTFGLSFSPTNQPDPMNGSHDAQEGGAGNPVQDAIRTMSYRVPRQTGGQGLAPAALLSGQGAAGMPSQMGGNQVQMGLEQLLRMLFGGGGMEMQGGGMPSAAGAPGPRIIPGATASPSAPSLPSAPGYPQVGGPVAGERQHWGNANPRHQGGLPQIP